MNNAVLDILLIHFCRVSNIPFNTVGLDCEEKKWGFMFCFVFPYHLGWPQIAKDRKKSNYLPDILRDPQQRLLKVEDFLRQLLNINIRKGTGDKRSVKRERIGPSGLCLNSSAAPNDPVTGATGLL